jgi:LacI family transcriptional regulator
VKSRDVAKLAGVSRTTVSFVLNNVPGMRISEETRRRVLKAAKELDYHPDASARRLVTGKTQILAYVERQTPELAFADAFMPQALRGVHDAASAYNYEVLFAPIPLGIENGRFSRLLRGHHVDGIILSGPRIDDEELQELIENHSPIVLQGQWPGQAVASVDVDNVRAAQEATEHLLRLGHKRIGMIVHTPKAYTAGKARLQGYRKALKEYGIDYDERIVAYAKSSPASGEEALRSLMQVKPTPSAFFIGSDTVAMGVLQAAKEMGYRVPEDLAIVGFDDIPMSVYLHPPLTTVHLPAYGIGWAAADLLIRVIDREETTETEILLDTELVVRESCGSSMV